MTTRTEAMISALATLTILAQLAARIFITFYL